MTYAAMLAALYGRSAGGVRLGLGRIRALLAGLGHPERRLRAVGVAGTNGKGSTSAMLAACLAADGGRVGLFTSPHLLRFGERIQVDGRALGDDDAVRLYRAVDAAGARLREAPSFFEVATAMAVLAFVKAEVDWAVLEVGLGGRLDATRAVPRELAVITPISYDHRAVLGRTLGAIAGEKAGIIAPRRPVVLAPQRPAAARVLLATARRRRAPVWWAEPAPRAPADASEPSRTGALEAADAGPHGAGDCLPPYQAENLGTAATAARLLGCAPAAIAAATARFGWPGRYQRLGGRPDIIVDAAHNPAGVAALLAALRADRDCRGRRRAVIFSALVDKEARAMLRALAAEADAVVLCPLAGRRGADLHELAALARAAAPEATVACGPAAALAAARRAAGAAGVVVVAGSVRLAGAILAAATGAPCDPPVDG